MSSFATLLGVVGLLILIIALTQGANPRLQRKLNLAGIIGLMVMALLKESLFFSLMEGVCLTGGLLPFFQLSKRTRTLLPLIVTGVSVIILMFDGGVSRLEELGILGVVGLGLGFALVSYHWWLFGGVAISIYSFAAIHAGVSGIEGWIFGILNVVFSVVALLKVAQRMRHPTFRLAYPDWVYGFVDFSKRYPTDVEKMGLAIALSEENVRQGSSCFGAVVFSPEGYILSVGMNQVVPGCCSVSHAEAVAIILGQAKLGSFSFAGSEEHPGGYELFTSCAPCIQCYGVLWWAGLSRMVCALNPADVEKVGFSEGPVTAEMYDLLRREKGMELTFEFMRGHAQTAVELFEEGVRKGTRRLY